MNTLYPDATPEELQLSDNICIICREDMVSSSKKLPCGHIFHTACLRSWFQRQQTCPTCRLNILRTPITTTAPNPIQPAAGNDANNQNDANRSTSTMGAAGATVPGAAAAQANCKHFEYLTRLYLLYCNIPTFSAKYESTKLGHPPNNSWSTRIRTPADAVHRPSTFHLAYASAPGSASSGHLNRRRAARNGRKRAPPRRRTN